MRFSTPASRPFCDLEILRPSFFFSTTFQGLFRSTIITYQRLSSFIFVLCKAIIMMSLKVSHSGVLSYYERQSSFTTSHIFKIFDHKIIDVKMMFTSCASVTAFVFNISWEFVSSGFYKKRRRSLTIFNNPDEERFISLSLSSAGVYIACVYRTLSLKWATGASPLRCLLACFDPCLVSRGAP